jgi:uncharacterized phage-associated protein
MEKPYKALAVANYFLDLAASKGSVLDPMKLQKLIYYAHGWNLAIHKKPLIDEPIQAWRYGPVIPSVYQQFKQYGAGPITSKAHRNYKEYEVDKSDEETIVLLNRIWDVYGRYGGITLSNMTHSDDGPWAIAWKEHGGAFEVTISNEAIAEYFVQKALKNRAKGAAASHPG